MPDEHVQFEEDVNAKVLYSRMEASSKTPKMVEFVVKKGWAKNEKGAMWILLGVVVVAIVVAIAWPLVFGVGEKKLAPEIDIPAEITPEEALNLQLKGI